MEGQNLHQLQPGTVLQGRYRIERLLGAGGFGMTYRAVDETLQIAVAIKEYFPSQWVTRNVQSTQNVVLTAESRRTQYENLREKFLNEARTLAMFEGMRHVVRVRDFFYANETAYIVMEYLDGVTLGDYAEKQGRMDPEWLCRLIIPMLYGLDQVHQKGLIHRDISPDNIMLMENNFLKLMDFGAARSFSEDTLKSMSVILKHGYAPYEQYTRHGRQGPWTDVYALSATMYYCITLELPDSATDRGECDEVKRPSELGVTISPAVEAVIMKGMSFRREDRFQSAEEMARALEEALKGKAPDVQRAPARRRGTVIVEDSTSIIPEEPAAKPPIRKGPITLREEQLRAQEEKRRREAEEAARRAEEEAAKRAEEERIAQEEKRRQQEEDARRAQEEEARRRALDEAAREAQEEAGKEALRNAGKKKARRALIMAAAVAVAGAAGIGALLFGGGDEDASAVPAAVTATAAPTAEPTSAPTKAPTAEPTKAPTAEPTKAPTAEPTKAPTAEPTKAPTAEPTKAPTAEPTKAPTAEPTSAPAEADDTQQGGVTVGSTVRFGAYEQDNDAGNGKEPIEWTVLDISEGQATLISVRGLDCRRYHTISAEIAWKDCSLRGWLNGEFAAEAFTGEQLGAMHADNLGDKVTLLTAEQAKALFADNAARMAEPTAYAAANGAFAAKSNGCSWWWLREDNPSFTVASVVAEGTVLAKCSNVSRNSNVIRPVIVVDMGSIQ